MTITVLQESPQQVDQDVVAHPEETPHRIQKRQISDGNVSMRNFCNRVVSIYIKMQP